MLHEGQPEQHEPGGRAKVANAEGHAVNLGRARPHSSLCRSISVLAPTTFTDCLRSRFPSLNPSEKATLAGTTQYVAPVSSSGSIVTIITATVGAIILLAIYRAIAGARTT